MDFDFEWLCFPDAHQSEWVVCPHCDSEEAHIDGGNYEARYHCPDCDETYFIAGG